MGRLSRFFVFFLALSPLLPTRPSPPPRDTAVCRWIGFHLRHEGQSTSIAKLGPHALYKKVPSKPICPRWRGTNGCSRLDNQSMAHDEQSVPLGAHESTGNRHALLGL